MSSLDLSDIGMVWMLEESRGWHSWYWLSCTLLSSVLSAHSLSQEERQQCSSCELNGHTGDIEEAINFTLEKKLHMLQCKPNWYCLMLIYTKCLFRPPVIIYNNMVTLPFFDSPSVDDLQTISNISTNYLLTLTLILTRNLTLTLKLAVT